MNTKHLAWIIVATLTTALQSVAADSFSQSADGVMTWTPSAPAAQIKGELNASRWGMYDVEAQLAAAESGKLKGTLGAKELSGSANASAVVKLGRVYIEKGGKTPLTIETEPADAAKPLAIKALVLTPAPEGKPIVQADDLSITLHARDATVHGTGLRYEIAPQKNTLGFWGKESDWVSWDFELKKTGKYNVFAMQGSGGGSEIEIAVGDQKLNWTTKNSGGFHTFTFVEAGTLNLDKPGQLTLTLKPTKKVGGAVMDLRQVMLLPVLK